MAHFHLVSLIISFFLSIVSDDDNTPKPRTAYCTVKATYTAPAEQIPEKPTYCTTCTTEGKVVMAAFAVEGCILIIIVIHIVHHIYQVKHAAAAATLVTNVTGVSNATNVTTTG